MFESILLKSASAKFVPQYDSHDGIRALLLEGEPYEGKKTQVFAYYGVPNNAVNCPAVVLIHGGGGHAYSCWVQNWVERGFAAIAIDVTGYVPKAKFAGSAETAQDRDNWTRERNEVFADDEYTAGPDNDGVVTEKPIEDQWMFHAVAAAIKANSFLRAQPEIDSERIGVIGISWGGVITSILIGHDPRFAFAVPIYGSGYLGEGLSYLDVIFRREGVRKLWLAEERFEQVQIPVLWLAWNDDSAFSVQSNTLSYNATVLNNPSTRIALIDRMMHSHVHAWQREESYYFAQSVCGEVPAMPHITAHTATEGIRLDVTADQGTELLSATLFYITEPMSYRPFDKYGCGTQTHMSQTWKTLPATIENGQITAACPPDMTGYYVELRFGRQQKQMVVSTGYYECE